MTRSEFLAQKFYTPAEAAAKLRLQVPTVWKHIRLGKIKAVGNHRKLIAESELARLLGMN